MVPLCCKTKLMEPIEIVIEQRRSAADDAPLSAPRELTAPPVATAALRAPAAAPAVVALVLLGMLWTLPNTLLGLLVGAAGLPFGARIRWHWRELAWVVRRWPWGSGGALTLGNVILHTGEQLDTPCQTYAHRAGHGVGPVISLAAHERAHVYQYLLFGPLFLPLYLLCGGISVRNCFERAADHYALCAEGWLPWSRKVVTADG